MLFDKNLELAVISAAANDKGARGFLFSRLRPQDFFDTQCRRAWVTLAGGDTNAGKELAAGAAPPGDLGAAVTRLRALSELRLVEAVSRKALQALSNGASKHPEAFLKQFMQAAARVSIPSSVEILAPEDWIEKGIDEFEGRVQGSPVIDLGVPGITKAVLPEPGHLVIIAGETGKGKTALALNIAHHLGIERKMPTLYVNTEMGWHELAFRLFSLMTGVPVASLRQGNLDKDKRDELKKLLRTKKAGAALYITDALPWADIREVLAMAREAKVSKGLKVLVVDYIQRLEDKTRDMEGWQMLINASRQLKSIAQELDILVVMLAQLNDKKQLAGSSGMLRDADSAVYLEEAGEGEEGTHVITVEKARHAKRGVRIPVFIDGATLKISDVVDESASDPGSLPEEIEKLF
ncbi:DnaB-like helicase C-terminal domain-containing protein [Moorella naiadis]|uniref:DnaB-like helicase C-terminal domain-containing protein n=1 Tax=Moorella naiadis (nom. illeg.) TaxID=3093670 RepID=UPI003D9CA965